MQLETLHVRHDRPDEETLIRVMWMLQRSDLDPDTLSKQLPVEALNLDTALKLDNLFP